VDSVTDPILLRKSCSAGNRSRDLWICSQKLWPLDHRGGPNLWIFTRLLKNIFLFPWYSTHSIYPFNGSSLYQSCNFRSLTNSQTWIGSFLQSCTQLTVHNATEVVPCHETQTIWPILLSRPCFAAQDGRGSPRKEVANREWDEKDGGKPFYTVMGFFWMDTIGFNYCSRDLSRSSLKKLLC
jgi:hypothetical protein